MANSAWQSLIARHGFSSTEEVANRARMSSGHLSLISRGLKDPRLRTAVHLAKTIGCSLEDLAKAVARDSDADAANDDLEAG